MGTNLNIDNKHFILGNNPELAKVLSDKMLQEFLCRMVEDIDGSFKDFIKKGSDHYLKSVNNQLKQSYEVIKYDVKDKSRFIQIRKSFTNEVFSVGEIVYDKINKVSFPIGLLYADDRGLHIRLDIDAKGTITWRSLDKIRKVK